MQMAMMDKGVWKQMDGASYRQNILSNYNIYKETMESYVNTYLCRPYIAGKIFRVSSLLYRSSLGSSLGSLYGPKYVYFSLK